MGLFDDVPDAPKAAAAPAAKAGLFDDVPEAKAAAPSTLGRAASVAGDVVQSAGAGLIRGAAGLIDLPQTIYELADAGADAAVRGTVRLFGGTPRTDRKPRAGGLIPSPAELPKPGETAIKGLEAATGKLYEPQTVGGEYARTGAEFLPGAGKTAVSLLKNALLPAVASETAGQATKGTAAEPLARGAAGLGAGVAGALHGRASTAERLFDKSFGTITPDELQKIQAVVADGAALRGANGAATPIDLTWAEAAQQVLGPRRAGDLLRVVEGQGGLSDFFARRADQIRAAGSGGLDRISESGATPTEVGTAAQRAAQAGVAGTPEGQAVIRASQAAGPRVSPDQAGQVIQSELRAVADAREATRTEQAARDYAAARAAPENVGIERTITVERPGEPIITPATPSRSRFEPDVPRAADRLNPSAPAESGPGPESLARFIARKGGIRLDGDARANEFTNATQQVEGTLDRDLINAGIRPESIHPDVRSRVVGEMMRDPRADALETLERVVMAQRDPPAPFVKSTTVREEIPDVRFGQVNPQAALDVIDERLRSAKGDVRRSLEEARRNLFGAGGRETDMTVDGLHQARERLDQDIRVAVEAGDGVKATRLQAARTAVDDVLKTVPEMATADARFAANSRPLEPFSGNTPLGRVVQRDPLTNRMAKPAEQVPAEIQGATATREFLANATPAARRAFEGRQVTRILDEVGGAEGGTSATAIRAAIRKNEDVLSQIPGARDRLQRLATAYEGREAVDRSPLGRIAKRPDVDAAVEALFPIKPKEGSAAEVTTAVQALSRSNPRAARDLVRMHLGTEFAEATQRLQSGPNQAGGAKFAAAIRGNDLQRQNIEAAIRALPNGEALNTGFSRLLDIFEATGTRQGVGSRTSFNNEALAELRKRGLIGEGGAAIATGGLKLPTRIMQRLDDWQAGKNVDRLAELLTSPEGGRRLAQLATAKPGAATIALLDRLTRITARGAQSGDRATRTEGEPLQLTVRPVP